MSTIENDVSSRTAVRALAAYRSSFAEPVVRPGPWTEDGLTVTTSIPRSRPAARAARSPGYFDRSYRERRRHRCTEFSVATVPAGSPIAAEDDVSTRRPTRASAAAWTAVTAPSMLVA